MTAVIPDYNGNGAQEGRPGESDAADLAEHKARLPWDTDYNGIYDPKVDDAAAWAAANPWDKNNNGKFDGGDDSTVYDQKRPWDLNRDGALDQSEADAYLLKYSHGADKARPWDLNGDGVASTEEHKAWAERNHEFLNRVKGDYNGDGTVDNDESLKYQEHTMSVTNANAAKVSEMTAAVNLANKLAELADRVLR